MLYAKGNNTSYGRKTLDFIKFYGHEADNLINAGDGKSN